MIRIPLQDAEVQAMAARAMGDEHERALEPSSSDAAPTEHASVSTSGSSDGSSGCNSDTMSNSINGSSQKMDYTSCTQEKNSSQKRASVTSRTTSKVFKNE